MSDDRRILIILGTNGLLYFAINQINAVLALFSIHLSLDALYLLLAALYMKTHQGLIVCMVTALVIDATLPIPLGTHVILYCGALVFLLRSRWLLRRENPHHVVLSALWCNFFIMLGLSLFVGKGMLGQSDFWLRFLADLTISQLLLIIMARWWVDAQRKILLLWEIDVAAELQQY